MRNYGKLKPRKSVVKLEKKERVEAGRKAKQSEDAMSMASPLKGWDTTD